MDLGIQIRDKIYKRVTIDVRDLMCDGTYNQVTYGLWDHVGEHIWDQVDSGLWERLNTENIWN
jgi:hypothetical protein